MVSSTPSKDQDDSLDHVFLSIPSHRLTSELSFEESTIGLASQQDPSTSGALRFTPSWRSSPVKIRQFLRGQNVPLHERDSVPVLLLLLSAQKGGNDDESNGHSLATEMTALPIVAAVWVRDQWMVDKAYAPNSFEEEERVHLLLQRKG